MTHATVKQIMQLILQFCRSIQRPRSLVDLVSVSHGDSIPPFTLLNTQESGNVGFKSNGVRRLDVTLHYMRYIVESDEGHKAVVIPTARKLRGTVQSLDIDLSQASLFSSPDPTDETRRIPQVLHPLKQRCECAFKQLDLIPEGDRSRSPIVSALFAFREKRLDSLLKSLDQSPAGDHFDMRMLESLSHTPLRERRILKKVIKSIDQHLTGYFSPEKEIGTFKQLASAFAKAPSIKIVPNPFPEVDTEGAFIYDHTGRHLLFDCGRRVAFTPSLLPTPRSVLSSLCSAGTLGAELVGVNQATLVELSTRRLYPDPKGEINPSLLKEIRGQLWKGDLVKSDRFDYYRSVWIASVSGATSLGCATIVLSHVWNDLRGLGLYPCGGGDGTCQSRSPLYRAGKRSY